MSSAFKPNLLCITPPYPTNAPPLGVAYLLAYLRANGCHDFDFLDLRLWAPYAYAPTYRAVGAFGETYVIDVPDLPLVLNLLRAYDEGRPLAPEPDEILERYCMERGMSVGYLTHYLQRLDRFFETFFAELPDLQFIGFSVWTSNFLPTLMAAAHLKRRARPPFILAGGPHVTESRNSSKLALMSGLFDAVAMGEGEETLLSVYNAFRAGRGHPGKSLPGTMQWDADTGGFTVSERPLLRLASLPLPAFDQLPLLAYPSSHHSYGRILPFQLSRGCTDKCSFCSEWVFWKRFRSDEVGHVIEQVAQMKDRYGSDGFWFMDSLLNGSMARLKSFAEEILKRSLKIRWGGFMRADMNLESARLLKRAGLEFTFLGIESLSDETLAMMNKRRTEAQNIAALRALMDAGVRRIVAGLIPGFPGDDRHRFLRTASVLQGLMADYPGRLRVNLEPFIVSPGQPIFAKLLENGLAPHTWDEKVLELAPRYRSITNEIFCFVDGANQGLDRLGELRIASSLNPSGGSGDPFLYSEAERLVSNRLQLQPLRPGWYLGQLKTSSSLKLALILSEEERAAYERFGQDEESLVRAGYNEHSCLLELEPFASFLRTVASRHVLPPTIDRPRIVKAAYRRELDRSTAVTLSPFVVGRLIGEQELLLVDPGLERPHVVSAKLASLLAMLTDRALPLQALEEAVRFVARDGGTEVWEGIRRMIDELKELGLVVCASPPAEEPPFEENHPKAAANSL